MQASIRIAGGSSFEDGRPPPAPPSGRLPAEEQPLRILVAEDEAMIALDIEGQLQDLGHDVVGIARTAQECIAAAALHRPDLVLMDIRLARGDGIAAAIELQERFAIPAVFMTAHADAETRRRALDAAPIDYLVKPVSRQRIEAALARARRVIGRTP